MFSRNKRDEWTQVDGQPDRAVFLTHVGGGGMEAEITVSRLRSFGIPAILKTPGEGLAGKVILGRSGFGDDVYVPESQLADALALISDDDFDETDGEDA
ncbi:MAG: DUF2007 domain-containing protein [Oscillospiraceae bacterium]|jgi:hypothetical protein|nr:DUF2007 domain-containing protein [Oscillospiraceae bacterium]